MKRAPEPTDVYWENLPTKTVEKVRKSFITYLVTFIILMFSFWINFGFGILKKYFKSANSNLEDKKELYLFLTVLISIVSSTVMSLFNYIMGRTMRTLSAIERHDTYTEYNVSVGLKLVLAMFINTALIPFAVNFYNEKWAISNGLIQDVFFNVISIWFFGPLIYLLSPSYFYNYFRRFIEINKGNKWTLTQRQLNTLFEGQPMDVAQRLSSSMLLLMVSCFYVVLLPLAPIICLFGGIYHYWINKYMLLRRHKIPEQMGKDLELAFRRLLPLVMLLLSIGQFLFANSSLGLWSNSNCSNGSEFLNLSYGNNMYIQIPLWISFLYFLYPLPFINNFIEKQKVNRSDEDTYEQHWKEFLFDYDKANPVKFKTKV